MVDDTTLVVAKYRRNYLTDEPMMFFFSLLAVIGAIAFAAGFNVDIWKLSADQYGWALFTALLMSYLLAIRASRGHIVFLYLFYSDKYPAWDLGYWGMGAFVFSVMFALGMFLQPALGIGL